MVKAGRYIVSLLGLAAVNFRDTQHVGRWLPLVVAGFAAVFLATAYMSWLFTSYRIADGEVRVDTGVVFKRSRRVRIDRLQAIDVVQPLFARALGLAELKLDMAGGEEGRFCAGAQHRRRIRLGVFDAKAAVPKGAAVLIATADFLPAAKRIIVALEQLALDNHLP